MPGDRGMNQLVYRSGGPGRGPSHEPPGPAGGLTVPGDGGMNQLVYRSGSLDLDLEL